MKRNSFIYETDSFRLKLYDQAETIYLFGEDYLDEYGYFVPNALIERFKANEVEREAIAEELRKIKEAQDDT